MLSSETGDLSGKASCSLWASLRFLRESDHSKPFGHARSALLLSSQSFPEGSVTRGPRTPPGPRRSPAGHEVTDSVLHPPTLRASNQRLPLRISLGHTHLAGRAARPSGQGAVGSGRDLLSGGDNVGGQDVRQMTPLPRGFDSEKGPFPSQSHSELWNQRPSFLLLGGALSLPSQASQSSQPRAPHNLGSKETHLFLQLN